MCWQCWYTGLKRLPFIGPLKCRLVSLTNLGGSLGFSVRLPVSAFTGLCAIGILDNNKTGTEKKGCLQDKSTTSLLCCIGKIWCFQVSRQVI